jgi:oxaloacetate decarboxylase (Na+ extruding) subunit alpha
MLLASDGAPQPSLQEIRRQYGERLSDEELLLRYLIPGPDIDAMYAANSPIAPIYPIGGWNGLAWLKEVMSTTAGRSVSVTNGSVSVALRR